MKRVIALARRVAIRSIPVLIEGESGTGKELMARAIHQASPRAAKPFITVNCGAIPPELVESEFFGHRRGSFTGAVSDRKGHFERADGGTLFLDEIGELPKAIQVKLLRTLQEGEVTPVGSSEARKVDVRVVAATNRTLISEVAEGNFREDLFYRLAVAIIKLPPLRERAGDLSLLIDALLHRSTVPPRIWASGTRNSLLPQEIFCFSTPGRAMFASCSTPCSAPPFGPTTKPSAWRRSAMRFCSRRGCCPVSTTS
jgi:transcriptional regulator with PAS, ATPase and Fis domain